MAYPAWRSRALACVMTPLLVLGPSCSFLMVQRPPPGPIEPTPPLECTSTLEAPIADTGVAAIGAVAMVVAATAPPPKSGPSGIAINLNPAIAVIGGLVALVAGISATVGYLQVADCSRWKDAQLSCASGVEESCKALRQHEL